MVVEGTVVDETKVLMESKPFQMSTDDIIKAMEHCARQYERYRMRYNVLQQELGKRLVKVNVQTPQYIPSEE